jgi:hypothetical protein
VRAAVVAGSFAACAGPALLGAALLRGDAALGPLGWLAGAALVTALGALWLRDRRRAERRGRFEEWWTQVSQRQGFASQENPDA